jgi:hypothetical protein
MRETCDTGGSNINCILFLSKPEDLPWLKDIEQAQGNIKDEDQQDRKSFF